MSDTDAAITRLLDADALREPLLRQIVGVLGLPQGSAGLDAGCGPGLQALLLADAVGPAGHVTGVDLAPELLAYGEELIQRAGYAGRVTLREGDVARMPFADESFDWAWSADCVGYPAGDLPALVSELARVVRPGGRVFVLAWTSQQLLPGHPFLEARLNATCSAYLPFLSDQAPERHFPRALGGLRAAGLAEVRGATFARTLQAPLTLSERAGLRSLFAMLWGQPQPGEEPAAREGYRRLCLPDSPDDILALPDYYGFFTYSLFQGAVVKAPPGGAAAWRSASSERR
ncbi:MAG TPA: class I SAM-dependent methyltransferase [Chloroflexaceae bacterium]|nr:class I SAM-dependent methyltransferase [Chloroflexaceae bacterium]